MSSGSSFMISTVSGASSLNLSEDLMSIYNDMQSAGIENDLMESIMNIVVHAASQGGDDSILLAISRSDCTDDTDKEEIIGISVESFFVYVRSDFRRMGVGSGLLKAMAHNSGLQNDVDMPFVLNASREDEVFWNKMGFSLFGDDFSVCAVSNSWIFSGKIFPVTLQFRNEETGDRVTKVFPAFFGDGSGLQFLRRSHYCLYKILPDSNPDNIHVEISSSNYLLFSGKLKELSSDNAVGVRFDGEHIIFKSFQSDDDLMAKHGSSLKETCDDDSCLNGDGHRM